VSFSCHISLPGLVLAAVSYPKSSVISFKKFWLVATLNWDRLVVANVVLTLAFTIALSVLVYGLIYCSGLPLNHDESNYFLESLRILKSGKLTRVGHGPLLYEMLAVLHCVLFLILKVIGSIGTSTDYLASILTSESTFLVFFRGLTLVTLLALLYQIYRVGKLFGGPLVGALAALFVSCNLTVQIMSSLLKADVVSWLLVFMAMELSWRSANNFSKRLSILSGICMGAAIAAKYLAAPVLILVLLPSIIAKKGNRIRAFRLGVVTSLTVGITLLVLYIPLFFDIKGLAKFFLSSHNAYAQAGGSWLLPKYFILHLPDLIGWPFLILGLIEFALRLKEKPRGPILIGFVGVGLMLALGIRSGFSIAYYAMVFALFLLIMTASFFGRVYSWNKTGVPTTILLMILLLFHPAFLKGVVKYSLLYTGGDTRIEGKRVFESTVAPKSTVLITRGVAAMNHFGPAIRSVNAPFGKERYKKAYAIASGKKPGPTYAIKVVSERPVLDWTAKLLNNKEWVIIPHDMGHPWDIDYNPILGRKWVSPPGYKLVHIIKPLPRPSSNLYPLMTSVDYKSLNEISIASLRTGARLGLPIRVFQKGSR